MANPFETKQTNEDQSNRKSNKGKDIQKDKKTSCSVKEKRSNSKSERKDARTQTDGNAFNYKKLALSAACMAGGAGVAIVAAPALIAAAGFTSAGISAGSFAASAMSTAWTSGWGIGAIGTFQSIGAAGLGTTGTVVAGAAGAGVGKVVHATGSKIHQMATEGNGTTATKSNVAKSDDITYADKGCNTDFDDDEEDDDVIEKGKEKHHNDVETRK